MATKICDYCDKEIGSDEKVCPACKVDFEESEAEVGVVSRALTVIEKRKAKEQAEKDRLAAEEEAKKPKKKKSIFQSLSKGVTK